MTHSIVTFISDLGTKDGSVGVVRSVVRSLAHSVVFEDLTHKITPFNITEASLCLARAVPYLQPGVVLAIVDPADSRPVIVEVGGGQSYLVGPDNGVLASAVALVGGATAAYEIKADAFVESNSSVSKARDVFAHAVARLCNGEEITDFATSIDTASLVPGLMNVAEKDEDGRISSQVLWIDTFGNIHLNVEPDQLPAGVDFACQIGELARPLKLVDSLKEVDKGDVVLMSNSHGLMKICARSASASEKLGIVEDSGIIVMPAELAGVELAKANGGEVHVELKL